MPRTRPQLSITLPKNFAFSSTFASTPKTPERPSRSPILPPSSTNQLYRLRRRPRPTVTSFYESADKAPSRARTLPRTSEVTAVVKDLPKSSANNIGSPLPLNDLLTTPAHRASTPRTPETQLDFASSFYTNAQEDADLLARPVSACSLDSNWSEDSGGTLVSDPAGDGSCTSPESETPIRKAYLHHDAPSHATVSKIFDVGRMEGRHSRSSQSLWTEEMDHHLWSTYLRYLQDPTMTPFKMLPGVAPPLGVCHRIAREAKKTWSGTKHKKVSASSPEVIASSQGMAYGCIEKGMPAETSAAKNHFSGVYLPMATWHTTTSTLWPKSSSSTRRRLRHLCKHRPNVAPHYQRLLQSRTPSPFSSSQCSNSRSQSVLSLPSSPPYAHSAAFSIRDVAMSLATSTSATMQPDNPLAQLATTASVSKRGFEDFNEPPVPFASEMSIPSDIESSASTVDSSHSLGNVAGAAPRLGSPFSHHTWGPSRTEQRARPKVQRSFASDLATIRPAYGLAMDLANIEQSTSLHKRRALYRLGESGRFYTNSGAQSPQLAEAYDHKVSRDPKQHPLQSLFDAPPATESLPHPPAPAPKSNHVEAPKAPLETDQILKSMLDSPFQIGARRRVRKPLQLNSADSLASAGECPFNSHANAQCEPGTGEVQLDAELST